VVGGGRSTEAAGHPWRPAEDRGEERRGEEIDRRGGKEKETRGSFFFNI
jgi:hypothetical protein